MNSIPLTNDDSPREVPVTSDAGLPIFLLSGMAADERLFADQQAVFPNLRVLPWIEPQPGETLRCYAERISRQIDPSQPCLIGGASFGGIVALEMAQHIPAVACILIGSLRSPDELPLRWKWLRPIAAFGPEFIRKVAVFAGRYGRPFLSKSQLRRFRKLSRPDASFVRWAICAVLQWKGRQATHSIPIYQIHGSADEVLPLALTHPDIVVAGGVHALPIFSPTEVSRFIADVIAKTGAR